MDTSGQPLANLRTAVEYSYPLDDCSYVFLSVLTVSPTALQDARRILNLLQAYAYDWLLSMTEECEIILRAGVTPSIALYFVSRYAAHTLTLRRRAHGAHVCGGSTSSISQFGTLLTIVLSVRGSHSPRYCPWLNSKFDCP